MCFHVTEQWRRSSRRVTREQNGPGGVRREMAHHGNDGNCAQTSFNKQQTSFSQHSLSAYVNNSPSTPPFFLRSKILYFLCLPPACHVLRGFLPLNYSRIPQVSARPTEFKQSDNTRRKNTLVKWSRFLNQVLVPEPGWTGLCLCADLLVQLQADFFALFIEQTDLFHCQHVGH